MCRLKGGFVRFRETISLLGRILPGKDTEKWRSVMGLRKAVLAGETRGARGFIALNAISVLYLKFAEMARKC